MARVTASKNSRLKKKPEVEIDDAIRRLVKCVLELKLKTDSEYKKADLETKNKAEIVGMVTDMFGDAVYTLVDCAVTQEIALTLEALAADEDEDEDEDPTAADYDSL